MDLLTAKIVSMVLLGALALFFGLLPLKVTSMILKGEENTRKRRRRERIVSGLLCFGSGVLMATVFIHMIPETREGFARAKQLGLWGSEDSNHARTITEDDHADRHMGFRTPQMTENLDRAHDAHAHYHFHQHHAHDEHVPHHGHGKHDHEHDHTESSASAPTWETEEPNHFRSVSDDSENLRRGSSGTPVEPSRSPPVSSSPHHHHHHTTPSPHVHDHPHDNDNLRAHLHDHDSTEIPTTRGTIASTHLDPVTSGGQNAKSLEAVVNEEEKILEHPQENSIRASANGSGEGIEPRTSALTHTEAAHGHAHDHDHDHDHDHEDDHGYPLAELSICAGFFLIYIIEELMHKILFRRKGKTSEKKNLLDKNIENGSSHNHSDHLAHIPHFHAHSHSHTSSSEDEDANPKSISNDTGPKGGLDQAAKVMSPRSEWGSHGVDNPVFAGDIDATTWNPKVRNSLVLHSQVSPIPSNDPQKIYGTASECVLPEPPIEAPKKQVTGKRLSEHILANFRSLLIVMALSFHSVFEGMAVGLQLVLSDVWYLFLAISAHKFVIVFCIGLELLEAKTPLVLMILYIVVLALVSPIGVGIGIIVTENSSFGGHEHTLIIAILQGIAGGTILYVAFLEVLERERSKRGGRIIKLFCLILGFALMASLEALGAHSHAPIQRPG